MSQQQVGAGQRVAGRCVPARLDVEPEWPDALDAANRISAASRPSRRVPSIAIKRAPA